MGRKKFIGNGTQPGTLLAEFPLRDFGRVAEVSVLVVGIGVVVLAVWNGLTWGTGRVPLHTYLLGIPLLAFAFSAARSKPAVALRLFDNGLAGEVPTVVPGPNGEAHRQLWIRWDDVQQVREYKWRIEIVTSSGRLEAIPWNAFGQRALAEKAIRELTSRARLYPAQATAERGPWWEERPSTVYYRTREENFVLPQRRPPKPERTSLWGPERGRTKRRRKQRDSWADNGKS